MTYDIDLKLFAIPNIIRMTDFIQTGRGKYMEYMTSAEFAEKWNISQRRVGANCKEGRIEGAVPKGRMWVIPTNAKSWMILEKYKTWNNKLYQKKKFKILLDVKDEEN